MDHDKFKALRDEFETDIIAVVKALRDFAAKWHLREKEVQSLTPEQEQQLGAIAIQVDKAFNDL